MDESRKPHRDETLKDTSNPEPLDGSRVPANFASSNSGNRLDHSDAMRGRPMHGASSGSDTDTQSQDSPVAGNDHHDHHDRGHSGGEAMKDENEMGGPPSKKPKRDRRNFSTEETIILEAYFLQEQHPSATELSQISADLRMDARRIQVWFYNRRARAKREAKNSSSKGGAGGVTSTTLAAEELLMDTSSAPQGEIQIPIAKDGSIISDSMMRSLRNRVASLISQFHTVRGELDLLHEGFENHLAAMATAVQAHREAQAQMLGEEEGGDDSHEMSRNGSVSHETNGDDLPQHQGMESSDQQPTVDAVAPPPVDISAPETETPDVPSSVPPPTV